MHILDNQINNLKFNNKLLSGNSIEYYPTRLPNVSDSNNGIMFNGENLCELLMNDNMIFKGHIQDDRFNKKYGLCCRNNCRHYITNHEHIVNNKKCEYCGKTINTVEIYSKYTNYSEKHNSFSSIETISAALPEEYRDDSIIHIDAVKDLKTSDNTGDVFPRLDIDYHKFDEIEAGTGDTPYAHVYCTDNSQRGLEYGITTNESGIYEMLVHYRIKDTQSRGAKFCFNQQRNDSYSNDYAFDYTYSNNNLNNYRNNSLLVGSYLKYLEVPLTAGYNCLKIYPITEVPKQQHFRDFYFRKVGDICEHELNSSYQCIHCGKNFYLSVSDAENIGHSLAPGIKLTDDYYVSLNFNYEDPRYYDWNTGTVKNDGFCRVLIDNNSSHSGHYMSVYNIIKNDSFPVFPVKGMSCIAKCKLGCVTSAKNSDGKEARLYDVSIEEYPNMQEYRFIDMRETNEIILPTGEIQLWGEINGIQVDTGVFRFPVHSQLIFMERAIYIGTDADGNKSYRYEALPVVRDMTENGEYSDYLNSDFAIDAMEDMTITYRLWY